VSKSRLCRDFAGGAFVVFTLNLASWKPDPNPLHDPNPLQAQKLSTMVHVWCIMPNMKAALLKHDKFTDEYGNLVEMKIWKTPTNEHAPYGVKYSLVYVVDGQRVIGYDNERGKGDHRHRDEHETPYRFIDIDLLVEDFLKDVEGFIRRNYEGK
jgi:hypothetical protein